MWVTLNQIECGRVCSSNRVVCTDVDKLSGLRKGDVTVGGDIRSAHYFSIGEAESIIHRVSLNFSSCLMLFKRLQNPKPQNKMIAFDGEIHNIDRLTRI